MYGYTTTPHANMRLRRGRRGTGVTGSLLIGSEYYSSYIHHAHPNSYMHGVVFYLPNLSGYAIF